MFNFVSTLFHSRTKSLFAFGFIGLTIVFSLGECVQNNEMAPTLPQYSWTWNSKGTEVNIGDLVWVQDPTMPSKKRLLRIIGTSNDNIQYVNDGFLRNNKRFPVLDMREWDERHRVWKETFYQDNQEISWEIIQPNLNSGWKSPKVTNQTNTLYVACDHRSQCVDSRWWGPISTHYIDSVVRMGVCLFCKDSMNSRDLVLYY